MLLRRLRCDELGVCQARHPFCQGCFDPIAPSDKTDKIKPARRGELRRSGSVPAKTVTPGKGRG
jgi:hypothetical protein